MPPHVLLEYWPHCRRVVNSSTKGDRVTIRVHGRNMQVPDATKEVAEERVRHAGRIFDDGSPVDVEFTEERNPRLSNEKFTVEITSKAAGHIVRIEEKAAEARTALDQAADRYERQLRRLKERLIQRNRQGKKELNHVPEPSDAHQDRDGLIVKTKRFEMKPMTAQEAALQMDMLGHDFFFFLDGDSNQHGVVYRRNDGAVGLIQPE